MNHESRFRRLELVGAFDGVDQRDVFPPLPGFTSSERLTLFLDDFHLIVTDGLQGPCPGDTNGDNVIDIDDIVNVVLDFGCALGPACPNGGDVDGSGAVDIDDIVFVVLNFGNPC